MRTTSGSTDYQAFVAVQGCLTNSPGEILDETLVARSSCVKTKQAIPELCDEKSMTIGKNHLSQTQFSTYQDKMLSETFAICPIIPNNSGKTAPKNKSFSTRHEVDYAASDDTAELLRWHQRLNHLSFRKLKLLAELGIIPKRLVKARTPRCACCIFGTMTRKRTRHKKSLIKHLKPAEYPGQVVSVDQMESSTPGLIAQLKGRLTTQRYKYATVFVDHFSRLGYVHLQRTTNGEETLEAKHAFEAFCADHRVKVSHYHADNGRFCEHLFMDDLRKQKQTISCCGVSAHHQNGIGEKRIRDLSDTASKMLLHAACRWPSAITTALWPYAVRQAQNVLNTLPFNPSGQSPLEVFSNTDVAPSLDSFHTFGCPVFALDPRLQNHDKIPRWDSRARLGIHLGHSPHHARSVSLVLSTSSGCVSPQFHVLHDDFFETVRGDRLTQDITIKWQLLSGFQKTPTFPDHGAHDEIVTTTKRGLKQGTENEKF